MAIKDILVHADTQPGSDGRIAFAASLAKKSEVHLTGLHVKADVVIPVTGNEGMIPQSLIDDQERAIELQAEAAKNQFDSAVSAYEIEGAWLVARGAAADLLRHHSHSADLIIVGQQHPDATQAHDIPEGVLQDTGCPTLIVPYAGMGRTFAQNVMVAWDDSAPAARAIHDALALIPETARYDVGSGKLLVVGSWIAMLVILGIFFVRYAMGVGLAMQLEIVRDHNVQLAVSLVLGAFSGFFLARGLVFWRIYGAHRGQRAAG
jgi:nucleotide-binding universal stress UspA family protein